MSDDIHIWDPMSPEQVHELLGGLSQPWWLAGGWAIDLFLDRKTRGHADTDVVIVRSDQFAFQEFLSDWDLYKTQQPGLKPWPKGEYLNPGVNDIWCRRTPYSPWAIQLMLLDTIDASWVFRRNRTITRPIDSIGRRTKSGIPYLSPEIQLLYKAKRDAPEKDDADFRNCLPRLSPGERTWLVACLAKCFPGGHEWITVLKESEI